MKIGIVGYSSHQIDVELTRCLLNQGLARLLALSHSLTESIELVSGLTNIGVPKVAYQLADERGWYKVGISAQAAFRVKCGVYPVDHQRIVGEQFGDESETFIHYIDHLIRVGGGKQSRREVALFKQRCEQKHWPLAERLVELEMELKI